MSRLILWCGVLFISFSVLVYGWVAGSGAQGILERYQQMAPFSADDMSFRAAGRTLFKNGVVLYRPIFPRLPLKNTIERLSLNLTPAMRHIRLSGMVIDVNRTLLQQSQDTLINRFKTFTPPYDFIRHPLETLALLNRDIVMLNIDITLTNTDHGIRVLCRLEPKNEAAIEVRTTLTHVPGMGLWDWTKGQFQTISFMTQNQNLLRAIMGYYHAIRQPVLSGLKQAIDTKIPFQAIIRLPVPLTISDLFIPE